MGTVISKSPTLPGPATMSPEPSFAVLPSRAGLVPRLSIPSSESLVPSPMNATRTIRDLAGRTVVWRQPSQLRQEYEMVAGEEIVATLRWRKNVGTTAVARSPDGTWTFKAAGFLNPRVTVRLPTSDYDFAVFRARNTGEGELEAMADQRFIWRCVNFWQNTWAFFNPQGERLLQLRAEPSGAKTTGILTIEPKSAQHPESGYLVVLGWYLLVLMAGDAAASQPAGS